ncbi:MULTISPECIES: flagellar brake protein [unclassified Fusibacter]|uniref:flagellar brake protein n=1 Tax=unclassified Fusibacter TaxID=2624464 RepID=UPI0010121FFB|nr:MULTISPECIES: PilZ domain-containing protein [unclassified Fusibacter]MCK8058779.1 PilZ domain-containing protein [Fusibacter sp. A2]NPE21853.1 hypothetical protein [Fusibacter sp. A1]RXV61425.1 hypothetical protein DWB64_08415 [Fusibacter sp. A1]
MSDGFSTMLEEGATLYAEIFIEDTKQKLKSEILEIVNDNKVIISCPIYKMRLIQLNVGERFRFEYQNPESGLFQFVALVVNKDKLGPIVRLHLLKVSNVKKEQRREFFRLPIIENVILKVKIGETTETYIDSGKKIEVIVPEFEEYVATALDLSAGGLKAISKIPISVGTPIYSKFELDGSAYELEGTVLRCFRIEDVVERYELGIKFKNIENTTQTNLIAVIFNKQRKMLKKGMI